MAASANIHFPILTFYIAFCYNLRIALRRETLMIIDYKKEGRLAIFTINRPEALNAINVQAARELHDALANFRDDPEL